MAQFSLELRFRVAFLAVLLPLASGACVDLDLGMGRGTIPNSDITASSVQNATTPAKNSRLNYTSGSSWCARTTDTNPYLQIDLQTLHIICAVSTQGNSRADQWVKNYTLQFSTNGTTWTDYKEGGQVKFLRGNDDRNSEVKHVVYKVLTRYLRFLPKTHQGGVCMRTEVFGVEQKLRCSMQAIGVAKSDTIPDSSFSALSEFNSVYAAKYGRLNNTKSWAPRGNNNGNDYLQIDLLFEYVICAVATQGNPRAREWTTKYKFQFSHNSSKFVTYQENNANKVFPGNSNQNGIVKNSLQEAAIAKFIRFQPTTYRNYKGLRVEVYGIILTKVPSQPPTDFKLTASSSTSIMASWKLPPVLARHGRTITGFILFYKKKISGVPATKLNIMDGSTLSRNVTGLDEYTEYEFQVLAYTTDGNGPKSPVEVERTNEAAPSRAPSSFNVIAVTSTIITASWHLPPADSRNGVIKGFKLFYKKRGSNGSETLPINNGTAFSKDVIGLDNNTEYEFEVLAFTSVGDGPKSPVVVVRTRKYGCDEFNLGMEDGTIPNNTVTASSEQSASTSAKNGRLNYTSGSSWCARTSDSKPHLQIDLQTLHIICAVSTQGNSRVDQWVTTYRLQLSTDGTTWKDYKEGGQVKALRGNNDRYSEVKHVVYGVLTRYLRFLPQTHQGGVCMRTEVFGVKQKPICNMEAIGLASGGAIPDSSFTATSFYDVRYESYYGRLDADELGWAPKTKTNPADFLQIDLLYEYFICAVATQGSSGSLEWTTEYKIHLSLDGTTFFAYKETSTDKLFPGNSNKNGVVKHSLQEFARAKIIRFQPIKYHNWPVLRVEVYGILLTTTVPSQPPTDFKLTASSSTSITASWKLPPLFARHGRNITGFKLFHKKKGSTGSASSFTINSGSILSRLVTELDEYTEYELQVLAFTSYSVGAKSPVEVERTKEDAPSQPPSSLTVTAVTSSAITASWQLPPLASRNGIIKGFKLFFKEKGSAGLTTTLLINSGLTLSRNVTGLKKYTEYEFQVLAFTSVGNGPKSHSEVERTKEDVPSQSPGSFTVTAVTSTTVTATWQLPPEDSRNGVIKGFKLFYKKNGFGGSATNLTFNNGTALGKDVPGLDNNTEYEFQVLAFTSVGDGPKSSVEVVRTMKDGGCVEFYLGMENGGVPDDKISASSELNASTPAKNGRQNYLSGSSWCAGTSDTNPYLQIDLQTFHIICAVSTQGNSEGDQWVKNYALQLSTDGTTWRNYTEGGQVKVFEGNDDRSSNVKHIVYGVLTKYLRFIPQTHQGGVCMRTEIFGVKQESICNMEAIGLASGGTIPSSSFTATSFFNHLYKPFFGRLNADKRGWAPKTTTNPADFLQIDLLYEHFICAIATQGSYGSKEWTTEYKIHLSLDGTTFSAYDKVFPGNSNKNGIVKNSLQEFASAKFIRFQPTDYRVWKVLRVEVYGILVAKVPSKPPTSFTLTASSSTSITASWQLPQAIGRHGRIEGFKLFHTKKGTGSAAKTSIIKNGTEFSREVSGLERYTKYEFQVLAFTSFGDGPNSTVKAERTMEDAPSVGPGLASSSQVDKTTFNISWEPLPREKSHGKVTLYEVKAIFLEKGNLGKRSVINSPSVNTSATFVVLSDLELCSKYNVSVRAYTAAGPGPYGEPMELETSRPEAPRGFRATDIGTTQVTLVWKQYDEKEKIIYSVKYTGTKSYNKTFSDSDTLKQIEATTQTIKELIPGTTYVFRVYGSSDCGDSITKIVSVMTDMIAPEHPVPHNISDVEVSETAVDIYLWPVEQKYGPISSYQVIVLKVADGVEELPDNYDLKLKAASDAQKESVNFYIAAEIQNIDKPRKFTVGDGKITEEYVNEELEKGENYIVYERALTKTQKEELKGKASIVAKISITSSTTEGGKKGKSSGSNAAVVAVPVVLLLLLIPAIVVAVFLYRRRRQSRSKSATERSVELDDLKSGSQDLTSSTSNLVYQNVGDIRRTIKGAEQQPVSEETEAIYSEADDGKPRPIPVAEFAKYFKRKSANGAIVLREEFKYLPGGMQFSWEIGKSNRGKNRYGNIVSYDHSRVLLEEIEGDKNSSYINASYIPTYDEVTMTYIATQGPTSSTIADFWRMVWQENSSTIVMLTNLVELGKGKCDQYWPDDATTFGAITVTLHKTETFADYVIRSLIVTKDAEKRNVQQFHYVTWPDKGVPHHSTALLGFRQKIHARLLATGGPLLVHCSAGVGRTGTYIAIDAMLESAEKIKTVFIQNYVQVMRKSRPHMIQKDDQYVFLHQAVMEALVCGNTEIVPQDLRITMNKLTMVHKPSKKTGYEQEFKRLELVTDSEASPEEAKQAFMPANVVKNRFPNVVPLDSARVLLQASSQDKSYINASFVDDYKQRNAYILTQAPLDNTILDLWQMISQYDIGTVVMLNNLKEGKQNYPQYWLSKESAKYGEVTVQLLSQETSNNITTRRFSVENAALPKKTSTLQHIQYTGWANTNSCPDPQEILDLMTAVQQSQQQSGNGVIVFQCSDGIGRSGCVATIMSVIERVKIEQTVDVFQTVKLVRAKRPGAVNTLEQYMFCYKTVVAYLDSFSTYSNFAEC